MSVSILYTILKVLGKRGRIAYKAGVEILSTGIILIKS